LPGSETALTACLASLNCGCFFAFGAAGCPGIKTCAGLLAPGASIKSGLSHPIHSSLQSNRGDAPAILSGSNSSSPPSAAQAEWIGGELAALGYSSCNPAFVRRCVTAHTDDDTAVTLSLLRAAFAAAPTLQAVLVVSAAAAEQPPQLLIGGTTSLFAPLVTAAEGLGVQLWACNRRQLMPQLSLRRARVQDHDELLPLLQRAATRHPALAQLPDSCKPNEPFALTRLITSQDAGNTVLVAHQRRGAGSDQQLVGFLVATCDVDVSLLHAAFDLGPYDGFVDPTLFERLEDNARTQAAAEAAAAGGGEGGQSGADESSRGREILASLVQRALAAPGSGGGVVQQMRPQEHHKLFAITMLCMEESFEGRAPDLLWAAFEAFPGKVGSLGGVLTWCMGRLLECVCVWEGGGLRTGLPASSAPLTARTHSSINPRSMLR